MSTPPKKPTRHPGIKRIGPTTFHVRATAICSRTGKRRSVQEPVEGALDDAIARRQQLREEIRAGGAPERTTLKAYARSWLERRVGRLSPATAAKYATDLDLHILPVIGELYVDALRPSDVEPLVSGEGWAAVNRLRLLRVIARDSVAEGVAERDWTARISARAPEGYTEDDPNLLDAAQLGRLLAYVGEHESQWQALILTGALTGLRFSELSALRWEDVDERRRLIAVRRRNWKGVALVSTKTKKRRTVPLGPRLDVVLREHRRRLVAEQHPGLAAGWLFGTRSGELHKGSPLKKVLDRVTRALNVDADGAPLPEHEQIPRVTAHGLRRTFNNLSRQVADRLVVQAMTGHITDAMTDHYSIVSADEKHAAQAAVLKLVDGSGRRDS